MTWHTFTAHSAGHCRVRLDRDAKRSHKDAAAHDRGGGWREGVGAACSSPRESRLRGSSQRCHNPQSHDQEKCESRAVGRDTGRGLQCGPLVKSVTAEVASELGAAWRVSDHQETSPPIPPVWPPYCGAPLWLPAETLRESSLWPTRHPRPALPFWAATPPSHPAHPSTVVPLPGMLPSLPTLHPWRVLQAMTAWTPHQARSHRVTLTATCTPVTGAVKDSAARDHVTPALGPARCLATCGYTIHNSFN